MINKASILTVTFTVFINRISFAAGSGDEGSQETLQSALIGFLPLAIFLVILYFFFRRQLKSPLAKVQQEYMNRQIEHTHRVEELLGRIATALEKSNDKRV